MTTFFPQIEYSPSHANGQGFQPLEAEFLKDPLLNFRNFLLRFKACKFEKRANSENHRKQGTFCLGKGREAMPGGMRGSGKKKPGKQIFMIKLFRVDCCRRRNTDTTPSPEKNLW